MVFCLVRRNAPGTGQHAAAITHLVQATWGTLNLQAMGVSALLRADEPR